MAANSTANTFGKEEQMKYYEDLFMQWALSIRPRFVGVVVYLSVVVGAIALGVLVGLHAVMWAIDNVEHISVYMVGGILVFFVVVCWIWALFFQEGELNER